MKAEKLKRVQQYECARVSALTGSVPSKMAEGLQRVSVPCRNRIHVTSSPDSLRLALTTTTSPDSLRLTLTTKP